MKWSLFEGVMEAVIYFVKPDDIAKEYVYFYYGREDEGWEEDDL